MNVLYEWYCLRQKWLAFILFINLLGKTAEGNIAELISQEALPPPFRYSGQPYKNLFSLAYFVWKFIIKA